MRTNTHTFWKALAATIFTSFLIYTPFYVVSHAFNGPGSPGGSGSGAIGVDTSNNLGVGTSTTSNTTKLFLVASSTSNSQYALRAVQPDGTAIFVIRNDGSVGVATSTPNSGTLTVQGNIFSTGAFTGTVSAANVTAGVFAAGNFAFPSSLGINTSTQVSLPANLSVYGTASVTGAITTPTIQNNGNISIQTTGANTISFITSSTARWTVREIAGDFYANTDNVSNIGYPGLDPAWVRAASGFNLSHNNIYLVGRNAANSADINLIGLNASDKVNIASGGQDTLISGNVGIGTTTTPSAKLHVFTNDANASTTLLILQNVANSATPGASLEFRAISATAARLTANYNSNNQYFAIQTPQTYNGALEYKYIINQNGLHQFYRTGGNESMRIDSNGYVGIGTSSPSYLLDVNGAARLIPSSAPTGTNGTIYYDSGANKFKCYEASAWANCVGSGGLGNSSGTANTLPLWVATSTLGNSLLTQSGTSINITSGGLGVGTSTAQGAGNIYATGTVTAAINFVGNHAANYITSQTFAAGNFAFQNSLGIATGTQVSLPQPLSVYGNGYMSGSLSLGTSTVPNKFTVYDGDIALLPAAESSVKKIGMVTTWPGSSNYFNSGFEFKDHNNWGGTVSMFAGRDAGGIGPQYGFVADTYDDPTGYPNQNTHVSFNTTVSTNTAVVYVGTGSNATTTRTALYTENGAVLAATRGSLGVGDATPDEALSVRGNAWLRISGDENNGARGMHMVSGAYDATNTIGVWGNGNNFALEHIWTGSGNTDARLNINDNFISFETNDPLVERARFTTSGFGIGTKYPSSTLHVIGGATISTNVTTTNLTVSGLGSSGSPCLSVSATGVVATTTCSAGGVGGTGSSSTIPVWTTGGATLTNSAMVQSGASINIASGGFGVGTSTVQTSGNIYGSGTITAGTNFVGNLGANYVTSQTFAAGNFAFPSSLGINTSTQASLPANLTVYGTSNFTATSTFLGNVGIGATNPTSKLFVGSGSPAVGVLAGLNVALGGASYISASNGTENVFMGSDGSGYGILGTLSNHPLVFRTNNSDQVRIATSGNVGIGISSPSYLLDVNGTSRFVATSTFSGKVGIGTSSPAYALEVIGTGRFSGDVTLGDAAGTDLTVGAGAGKIDAGTIDPVYTINGTHYATYVSGMTGVKEETAGVARLKKTSTGYSYTINFADQAIGSDLWLFGKTVNIKKHFADLAVILSPSFEGKAWYKKDPATLTLTLYASSDEKVDAPEVSYRLTAPRFDAATWSNYSTNPVAEGFVIND